MAKCSKCASTDSMCIHSEAHTMGLVISNAMFSMNITFKEFVERFDACPKNYVFTTNDNFTDLQKCVRLGRFLKKQKYTIDIIQQLLRNFQLRNKPSKFKNVIKL